ncbi:hypothetical protein [Ideonella sp. A 288]|uniref:hypothetical protein n=1 Tax=Ideonella sp. A 288 TaxID=1962181 RepID=UPI000B4C103A|nr:hypothetical protein [Ideonella sp. A 288]
MPAFSAIAVPLTLAALVFSLGMLGLFGVRVAWSIDLLWPPAVLWAGAEVLAVLGLKAHKLVFLAPAAGFLAIQSVMVRKAFEDEPLWWLASMPPFLMAASVAAIWLASRRRVTAAPGAVPPPGNAP